MLKFKNSDLIAGCTLSYIYKWGRIGDTTTWFKPNGYYHTEYCTERLYETKIFQELIRK